jgi:sulfite reductase (NADPH) flavoprotein alpha-component
VPSSPHAPARLLLQGGHFYVCGDASSMAGAVEKALLALLAERLPGGATEAEAYLQRLSDSGRYQRDVWY